MEWVEQNAVALLEIVGIVIAAGFAIFKGTDRFVAAMEWMKDRKLDKAFDLVVLTCQEVYDNTVRELKEASIDGEIDAADKKVIKDQAIAIAKMRLSENGLSVFSDAVPCLIEDAVAYLKTKYGKGAIAVNPTLPELPQELD